MTALSPTIVLFRARRRYLLHLTANLYRRYAHVAMLFVGLFGLALAQRPEAIAWPVRHFATAPGDWRGSCAAVAAWLLLVSCWALTHRAGIRGGPLVPYSRSLPIPATVQRAVDLGVLAIALAAFWAVMGYAAVLTLASPLAAGSDGRFWLYFAVLGASTLAWARTMVHGGGWTAQLLGAGLLVAAPLAPPLPACLALAAALALQVSTLRVRPAARPRAARGIRPVPHPILMIPLLQLRILARNWHAVLPRVGIVLALHAFAFWLIGLPDKDSARPVLLHLAGAATAGILSGLYFTLAEARMTLEPWLGSTPYGRRRWRIGEHGVAMGATGAVFALVALARVVFTVPVPARELAAVGLFWLAWIPLLGLAPITRHPHAVNIKAAMLAAALALGLNLP